MGELLAGAALFLGYKAYTAFTAAASSANEAIEKYNQDPELFKFGVMFDLRERLGLEGPIVHIKSDKAIEAETRLRARVNQNHAFEKDMRLTPEDIKTILKKYDANKGFFRRWFWDSSGIRDLRRFHCGAMKDSVNTEGFVDLNKMTINGHLFNTTEGYSMALQRAIRSHFGAFSLTGEIYQKLIDAKLSYEDYENNKEPETSIFQSTSTNRARLGKRQLLMNAYGMKNKIVTVAKEEMQEPCGGCFSFRKPK